MKVQLYAIFDMAAGIYQKPFFSASDGEVKRSFQDIATADDHPIGKHPEDYSLYRLGIFDDNTGLLTDETNECLWTAHEAIADSRNINQTAMSQLHQQNDELNHRLDEAEYKPGLTD